ncbi:MAG TPA: efflux RND transporter periplasmic adaptor subunit [Acidobacteriota bacterium]|nr:efflux RND transporter periplasmic adaptor subunit [Acidobacteriota bacterium]
MHDIRRFFSLKPMVIFLSAVILASPPVGPSSWLEAASSAADQKDQQALTVERRAWTSYKTFSGDLEALDSYTIRAPNVSRLWNFTITYMIEEGTQVEPGEVLIRFDASDLELQKLDKEKQKEEARLKIDQKEAEIETRRQDMLLQLAQAEKNHKVAELDADIDDGLIARSELEDRRFKLEQARVAQEKARERLANLEESAKAEMAVARLDYEQAELELRRIVGDLESMEVRSQARGIVLYATDWRTGRKIQTGDQVQKNHILMNLPDLDRLIVEVRVHHSDVLGLALDTPVQVRLDAYPERSFAGRVHSLPEAAKSSRWGSTFKFFTMKVLLQDIDRELMKPGMTARVRIPYQHPESLLVPRTALLLSPQGTTAVRRASDGQLVDVEVLAAGEELLAVEGDLSPGQALSSAKAGSENSRQQEIEWIEVERKDLSFNVTGSGLLRAAKSVYVRPPALPQAWNFKIARMAPEGVSVKEGDFVVQFDPTEFMKRLRQEQGDLSRVQKEMERHTNQSELQIKDLELELEQAKVEREKAETKLVQAQEFESNREVRKARLEADFARFKVETLEKKLLSLKTSTGIQLDTLQDKEKFYQARVKASQKAVQSLTVTAPISGVLVYHPNWNNEKKQVGDQVSLYDTFLGIPDLTTLRVEGQVAEVDAGKLRANQFVQVSLDAFAEQTLTGRIVEIGNLFSQVTSTQRAKVLPVVVELDRVDTDRMRPGMAARLEIAVERFEDVIAVPLAVIEPDDEGRSFVWVKDGQGAVRRQVKVGQDNGIVAIIEDGLQEGDQVAGRPLQGESGAL